MKLHDDHPKSPRMQATEKSVLQRLSRDVGDCPTGLLPFHRHTRSKNHKPSRIIKHESEA